MMTLKDLFLRIKDTTGMEVLTVSDMYTIYLNCAADLTSRGYREFAEVEILPRPETEVEGVLYFDALKNKKFTFDSPSTLRKILYLKLDDGTGMHKGIRIPATHPAIDTVLDDGNYYFNFASGDKVPYVYYSKNNKLVFEALTTNAPVKLVLGYYKKIPKNIIPETYTYTDDEGNEVTSSDVYDPAVLETITLPIREDLEDVFVFFGIYYVYNKRLKEDAMIQRHLNNYKYQVEDVLHELNYEDNFNEEESVIVLDDSGY